MEYYSRFDEVDQEEENERPKNKKLLTITYEDTRKMIIPITEKEIEKNSFITLIGFDEIMIKILSFFTPKYIFTKFIRLNKSLYEFSKTYFFWNFIFYEHVIVEIEKKSKISKSPKQKRKHINRIKKFKSISSIEEMKSHYKMFYHEFYRINPTIDNPNREDITERSRIYHEVLTKNFFNKSTIDEYSV
jgi:hypothetical protein